MAVRDPALSGKVVLLDAQPKVLTRLYPFAIQPFVIFLRLADPTAILAGLGTPEDSQEKVDKVLQASRALENEYGHMFTHIVDCSASLPETVKAVAKLIQKHFYEPYYFDVAHEFPLISPGHMPITSASNTKFPLMETPSERELESSNEIVEKDNGEKGETEKYVATRAADGSTVKEANTGSVDVGKQENCDHPAAEQPMSASGGEGSSDIATEDARQSQKPEMELESGGPPQPLATAAPDRRTRILV